MALLIICLYQSLMLQAVTLLVRSNAVDIREITLKIGRIGVG